jgi:endonuclease/exonuclease/phosphatase family metal-dependent hydrolase
MQLRKFLVLTALIGCATTTRLNYDQPNGPRYAGQPSATSVRAHPQSDTLRLVSFNIEFAYQVDSAIAVLTSDAALRGADVVLLQEMDADGTQRIAEALGMWYAYYPATLHPRTKRDMGNAVLSRWPIVDDKKLRLPHISRFRRTQRTATVATIRVGETDVRVYSAHLGTPADVGPDARRDQLRTILADAAGYRHVIIGGDMNSGTVGRIARDRGYAWPTERGHRTMILGRWDHIFLKGLAAPDSAGTGTVLNVRNASDHRPIWVIAVLP